jgi:hypothetical protein
VETIQRKSLRTRRRVRERDWTGPDEAENRLFDACCEVVEAAQELQRRAGDRQSAGAAMAAIGCLSAALDSLAASAGSMRDVVIASDAIRPGERRKAVAQRLEEARASLRRAAAACGPEGARGPRSAHEVRDAWRF